MVHTCVAVGCSNRKESGSSISFYRFPRDSELRQKWIQAVKRKGWVPNEGSRLCSEHFIAGEHSKNARSPDYVPSIFAHTSSPEKKCRKKDLEEFNKRIITIRKNAEIENAANILLHFKHKISKLHVEQKRKERAAKREQKRNEIAAKREQKRKEIAAETLLNLQKSSISHPSHVDVHAVDSTCVEMECRRLMEKNYELNDTVEKMFMMPGNSFKDIDKIEFCTSLPTLKVLQFILHEISPFLKVNGKLSKFQQLLMTLMYLCLNLCNQDLADRFNVSSSTVSRTVNHVIGVLNVRLVQFVVFWPDGEELRTNTCNQLTQ